MEKWGLGYEAVLRDRFPRLVHCRVSGFGADGPLGGFPGYDAAAFYGLVAPTGTPPAVVEKISAALRQVTQLAEVRTRMRGLTMIPGDHTPATFDRFMHEEAARWGGLVQRRNIRPG
jgi:crotonobetainyl-CoA:carnitine CoA-transferase CaiB-like acyl-CoA transferase